MMRTFRLTACTAVMITGLIAVAATAAPASAVPAPDTSRSAVPGAKLWQARFQGLGGYSDPAAMAASPNGADVYVVGSTSVKPISASDSYATVAYNALTGAKLWRALFHVSPKRYPSTSRDVAVSPDGSKVFVTGSTPKGMSTVAYDAATGAKLWAVSTSAVEDGDSLAVSPDGTKLFVTGLGRVGKPYNYTALAYSTASGSLLWMARYINKVGVAYRIPQAAVSPDGSEVFMEGQSGKALATIAFNATTGARLWVQRFTGLGRSRLTTGALVVSPDSSTVFVGGDSRASASAPFSYATVAYDATTGTQRWAQYAAGLSNQRARTNLNSIAVKPDGTAVFVTGENTGANGTSGYSTIAYDAATGAKLWQQGYSGPRGSGAEAWFTGVSPDGSTVFVTGITKISLHFATLGYDSSSGAELWSAVDLHSRCVDETATVNPVTPEIMVAGGCANRAGNLNTLTVAYSG